MGHWFLFPRVFEAQLARIRAQAAVRGRLGAPAVVVSNIASSDSKYLTALCPNAEAETWERFNKDEQDIQDGGTIRSILPILSVLVH